IHATMSSNAVPARTKRPPAMSTTTARYPGPPARRICASTSVDMTDNGSAMNAFRYSTWSSHARPQKSAPSARNPSGIRNGCMRSPRGALAPKHATHPAARIGHVARIARDEMDVNMHAGLAGGLADVGADVPAVGRMLLAHDFSRGAQQRHDRALLRFAHVEEI